MRKCIFIIALVLLAGSGLAQERMTVGISLSGHTLRPWVSLHLSQQQPNNVNRFHIREAHHGYAGLGLLALGHLLHSRPLKVIGGILIIDDAVQHILRVDTPIHDLSNYLGKFGWYQQITSLGDGAFK